MLYHLQAMLELVPNETLKNPTTHHVWDMCDMVMLLILKNLCNGYYNRSFLMKHFAKEQDSFVYYSLLTT